MNTHTEQLQAMIFIKQLIFRHKEDIAIMHYDGISTFMMADIGQTFIQLSAMTTIITMVHNKALKHLHHFTDPIRYVSSILSIDIQYVSRYFLHYCQIGLEPTAICDVERSFSMR